jgi:5'-nucleotidase
VRKSLPLLALTTIAAVSLAACSSSGSHNSNASSTPASTSASTSAAPAVLHILVTNDDGYAADGISTVVTALEKLPNTEVTVVAPKTNQSGTGGRTTDGKLVIADAKTKDGTAAHSVAGTPADTIRAALDDLGLEPDLVVSGINQGQNLGPMADLSGTVGAARAAVARGIPAVAVSQGLGNPVNFAASAPFVTDWITQNRDALLNKTAPVQVVNINTPSCTAGTVRGLAKVTADLNAADMSKALKSVDCTSTADAGTTDVSAFGAGFASESTLPDKPAA